MIHQTQLTVIIPTFRREEGLKRALESLLDEQISSMEILVIDDSPEQSAREVVASFEDCRIRYLAMEHPSGGHPALVRNFGIDQAKGELLYFLDDDDHVIQGGLRALVDALEDHPNAGVAFGTVRCSGPDAAVALGYNHYFSWAARAAHRLRRSSLLTVGAIMFRGTLLINSCCLIRRSCALELSGYDSAIPVYEDVEFFTRGIRRWGHVFVPVPVLAYSTGLPSIIHDLQGDGTPIRDSYAIMHAKYRTTHGSLQYRGLQVISRLLPVGQYPEPEPEL